jgi:UDP-N-acetylmuramate--alanine ligase
MSALAAALLDLGAVVSGSDLAESEATRELQKRGARIATGHSASNLGGATRVVVTAAAPADNPELVEARRLGLPVVKRAALLGMLMDMRRGVAVAGTHGKTTTSAMIAMVLEEAGLDPTIIVGGMMRNLASNAKAGRGELLVVEADEYDRTFHHLHPEIAVVTNIEADHLEYYGNFEAIVEAFRIFLEGIRPGGTVVACVDEPTVAALASTIPQRVIGYGLGEGADVCAVNLEFHERGSSFDVPGIGVFKLFVPGEHNVRNALAAIAVARQLGIPSNVTAAALAKFLGVDRRFQILGDYLGAIIVDDYAHHPTEIRATLSAARRGYPRRRVVALFQPHLYSRTREFARQFAEALRTADVAMVAPIYAAREGPIEGISSRMISDAAGGIEFIDRSNAAIFDELRRRLTPNDLFITMGAGDVHEIAELLVRGPA